MDDHFKDECGVFGVFGHPEAANLTYLGLHGLQHRGQESAGIVSSDGAALHIYRQMGLVVDVFPADVLAKLPGDKAIGHVRYSTTGESSLKNAQPFAVNYSRGSIALAHNGNLVNAGNLREILEEDGSIFHSTSDSEVMIHLIARSRGEKVLDRIMDMTMKVKGAYSCLMLTEKKLVALRDPYGFRPLVLGRLGDAHVVSSETCALDLIEAKFVREIEPGELISISDAGLESRRIASETEQKKCIFELIYFARPDSMVFSESVYQVRKALGRQLALEQPAPGADIVIPVPDSGTSAAIGFAEQSGVKFDIGMIRSHYVGRTFIEPETRIRHFGVKLKLNPVDSMIRGKSVVVVDDSIVRGTTSRKIINMIKTHEPREVHLRISSPPTSWPCFYGIDTPTREELIASSKSVGEISEFIGCTSLGYLSIEGMHKAVNSKGGGYCDACFSGNYPIPVELNPPKRKQMRLFEEM